MKWFIASVFIAALAYGHAPAPAPITSDAPLPDQSQTLAHYATPFDCAIPCYVARAKAGRHHKRKHHKRRR